MLLRERLVCRRPAPAEKSSASMKANDPASLETETRVKRLLPSAWATPSSKIDFFSFLHFPFCSYHSLHTFPSRVTSARANAEMMGSGETLNSRIRTSDFTSAEFTTVEFIARSGFPPLPGIRPEKLILARMTSGIFATGASSSLSTESAGRK